jgi:hypothetical protein
MTDFPQLSTSEPTPLPDHHPVLSTRRRLVLAGGAALTLCMAAGGVGLAQTTKDVSEPVTSIAASTGAKDVLYLTQGGPVDLTQRRQDWLNVVASKLGVTPERVETAMREASTQLGLPVMMPVPPLPPDAGTGNVSTTVAVVAVNSGFTAAARVLGISEDQLHAEQRAGKSLADIARGHNADPRVVADALVAQRKADLDKAVAEGKLPKDTAEHLKTHLVQEIEQLMRIAPAPGGGLSPFRVDASPSRA